MKLIVGREYITREGVLTRIISRNYNPVINAYMYRSCHGHLYYESGTFFIHRQHPLDLKEKPTITINI